MIQNAFELDASILTLSYSGDFDCCSLLCESFDRFAPTGISHRLFVPTHDLALFAPLAGGRRSLGSQDRDLLPRWLVKLPMPKPRLRDLLRLPRRNIYLSPFTPPVRGWIAQQIMKIAACADSPTEIIMHVDSDTAFIRPLTLGAFGRVDGKARFYRRPQKSELATHQLWRKTACRLLALDEAAIDAGDYINTCVVWRRSIVRRMIERIEQVGGANWRKILARTPHFSEYTMYGMFVESLGVEAAGHYVDDATPVHCLWEDELETAEEEAAFISALCPHQFACLIQSTMNMDLAARRSLFARVVAEVARQDQQVMPALAAAS